MHLDRWRRARSLAALGGDRGGGGFTQLGGAALLLDDPHETIHLVHAWYVHAACGVHAVCMPCACGVRAVHMRCACRVHAAAHRLARGDIVLDEESDPHAAEEDPVDVPVDHGLVKSVGLGSGSGLGLGSGLGSGVWVWALDLGLGVGSARRPPDAHAA